MSQELYIVYRLFDKSDTLEIAIGVSTEDTIPDLIKLDMDENPEFQTRQYLALLVEEN
jgi:hypothetical protein